MDTKEVLRKMAETGVSWCENGQLSDTGEKTTICGSCKFFSPENCDVVNGELEMCEE